MRKAEQQYPRIMDGARTIGEGACKLYNGFDKELWSDQLPEIDVCARVLTVDANLYNRLIDGGERPTPPIKPGD
jgi:hypothetical protein